MRQSPQPMRMNGDEPAIDQGVTNGYRITWNPDDGRFYVERDGVTVTTYRDLRNARQYAKKH